MIAYEADCTDADTRTVWSVVVTGMARLVRDPAALARYEGALRSWVDRPKDCVIRIGPNW